MLVPEPVADPTDKIPLDTTGTEPDTTILEPPAEVEYPTETLPLPWKVMLRASTLIPEVLPAVLLVAASDSVWLVCATVAGVVIDRFKPDELCVIEMPTLAPADPVDVPARLCVTRTDPALLLKLRFRLSWNCNVWNTDDAAPAENATFVCVVTQAGCWNQTVFGPPTAVL